MGCSVQGISALFKISAAIFYAANVLPEVVAKAKMLGSGDRSALDIPIESFSSA